MKQKNYDDSYKEEIINLALSSDLSYAELARDLGINYSTLKNWMYQSMKKSKSETEQGKPLSRQDYQALERQNRALQKELDLCKREIEFLKKASAYFASLK